MNFVERQGQRIALGLPPATHVIMAWMAVAAVSLIVAIAFLISQT